jgi:hypothetical protein
MPRTSGLPIVAPSRPVAPSRFSIEKTLRSIRLERIENRPPPTFDYCHYVTLTGTFVRQAIGQSASVCYDVFAKSRSSASRREAAALNQTMNWMGPASTDRLGSYLFLHLMTLGAIRAGLAEQLDASPADRDLIEFQRKVEAAILKVGVRIGRCRSAPDGWYHGDSKSEKLTDAMSASRKCIVECAMRLGGQRLFDAIASAMLPRPFLSCIAERSPALAASIDRAEEGAIKVAELLDGAEMRDLERVLNLQLDAGNAQSLIIGIRDLLSIPEAVKWGCYPTQVDQVTPTSVTN